MPAIRRKMEDQTNLCSVGDPVIDTLAPKAMIFFIPLYINVCGPRKNEMLKANKHIAFLFIK